jgi:hypothetical protein
LPPSGDRALSWQSQFSQASFRVFEVPLIGCIVSALGAGTTLILIERQLAEIVPFENIFQIQQWLLMAMDKFLLAYSTVGDKIQFQSFIRPAERDCSAGIDL